MPQTYFIIPTAAGEAKMANAQALGQPFLLTEMGVGDGNGALPVPDRNRTTLVNERRRAPINTLAPDAANPGQYLAEQIIPENVGGWWIRELGLYDADGTLCFIGNCPETYKPQLAEGSGRTQVVRMVVLVTGGVTVELKVDPAVVLATRGYCDTAIEAAMYKQDQKQSVVAATTANLGALSGLLTVDGVVLAAGNRVLVKDQVTAKDNGIYVVAAGAWVRAADADAALEVTPGMLVPVEQGAVNADSLWQLVTDAPIIVGTTALGFEMAAGKSGVVSGTYTSVTVDKRGRVTGATNPQADETTAGPVAIATQAETDAGVNDTKAITPKKLRAGFASSFGTNGYFALPSWLGGIVFQWGNIATNASGVANVTLPIAFPNACFVALTNDLENLATSVCYGAVGSTTTTSLVLTYARGGTAAGAANVFWFAVGR